VRIQIRETINQLALLSTNMSTECTYCRTDISVHGPVFVEEIIEGEREQTGQFCNYACLAAYIEEENLTADACCRIDL
jgi:hypothetical protein